MTTPTFSASNTSQSGISSGVTTQLTYSTVNYDVGGHFAANAWTPPSGVVWLNAYANAVGATTARPNATLSIYKNGSPVFKIDKGQADGYAGTYVFGLDICNGSDVYTVEGNFIVDTGTLNVDYTYFWGIWIQTAPTGHVRFNMPMMGR
jgi:hypothetical protein